MRKCLVRWINNSTFYEGSLDEFDGELEFSRGPMNSDFDGYRDVLECEVQENEIPQHWQDELSKLKSGFYEFAYSITYESESHEMPQEYAVVESLEVVKKSLRSFCWYVLNKILRII